MLAMNVCLYPQTYILTHKHSFFPSLYNFNSVLTNYFLVNNPELWTNNVYIRMFVTFLALCLEIVGTEGIRAISEIHVGQHTFWSIILSLTAVILLLFIVIDFTLTKKN